MEALIEQYLGDPLVLVVLLFAATFVLEEAAILMGAALAAAGELSTPLALLAVGGGVIASDWFLYALGAVAARNRRIAGLIAPVHLAHGRLMLERSVLTAGLLARLIPWLLFPVFVASGFLNVGFRRFALTNGVIALIYVLALFFGAVGIYAMLLDWLGNWTWAAGAAVLLAIIWGGRRATRRYFPPGGDLGT